MVLLPDGGGGLGVPILTRVVQNCGELIVHSGELPFASPIPPILHRTANSLLLLVVVRQGEIFGGVDGGDRNTGGTRGDVLVG